MNYIVILDNGHGIDTPGKRSPMWPDGSQLFEYEFNRDIVRRISDKLNKESISHYILVPETIDISLSERIKRANAITKEYEGQSFLISIHANAGGGTGWEVYTSPGRTSSDTIATTFFKEFEQEFAPEGWRMRSDYSDGDPDKEDNFAILTRTTCPAILTENFFMDTEEDCRMLMSEEGRERIANAHVNAIKRVIL